jgi:transketolase
VKIAGHHCGILTGPDGATHQATEDIASVRPWPGIEIYVPADAIEAKKATIASAKTTRPVYLRFSRDKTPIITTEKTPFAPGILYEYWVSDKPQATLFATGYVLYYALIAALELEAEGFPVNVVNASTIKPLDASGILSFTAKSKAIVTIEDHQVTGGLGGAIAEFLAKTTPLPMEFIGLQDTFAESGKPKELIEKYGLGASSIKKAVKKVIKRKTS